MPAKVVPIDALPHRRKHALQDLELGEEDDGDEEETNGEEETPRDALGNPVLLDEQGRPINPVANGNAPSRLEKEIEYVMVNVEDRLISLRFDLFYQRYRLFLTMITLAFVLTGIVLFLYGMSLTVMFEGRREDVDYLSVSLAAVCWLPAIPYVKYTCFPHKEERKKRRKLNWARRDRRKPTLFNQLVEEAQASTEPPPYKTRVVAHFRKREYPMVCATWMDFCSFLQDKTSLPVERQLIRYEQEEIDVDLTAPLHLPPYNLPQNAHLHVYNRGGYYTKNSKLKQQYDDIIQKANRKEMPKYEQPPDFDKEEPFSLGSVVGEILMLTPRLSSRGTDRGTARGQQYQQQQQNRRESQNSRSSLPSVGEKEKRKTSGNSFDHGRISTSSAASNSSGIGGNKAKTSLQPVPIAAKNNASATPVLPFAPGPSSGAVALRPTGGSSVASRGSTVGGSIASSQARAGDDQSYLSMMS